MIDDCIDHVTVRIPQWWPVSVHLHWWPSGPVAHMDGSQTLAGLGSAVEGFGGDLTDEAVEGGHIPGPTVLICLLRFIQLCHYKRASLHLELRHVSPSVSCLPPSRLLSIYLRAWDSRRQRDRAEEGETASLSLITFSTNIHLDSRVNWSDFCGSKVTESSQRNVCGRNSRADLLITSPWRHNLLCWLFNTNIQKDEMHIIMLMTYWKNFIWVQENWLVKHVYIYLNIVSYYLFIYLHRIKIPHYLKIWIPLF